MKANLGILPPLPNVGKIGRRRRAQAFADRALASLEECLDSIEMAETKVAERTQSPVTL